MFTKARSRCYLPSYWPIRITKDKSVLKPRNPTGLFWKKSRAVSTNKEDAFHLRRVCSCSCNNPRRMSPSSKVDLHVHSLPLKSKGNSLPLSCRYLPLPAASTMAPYSCWLCGSHKGLAAKERTSALRSNTKATWQLIFCETQCVWVSDWAWGSGWKFAHHSLKANSVQVLGPIVPQYVGSAVRAGCTPVLDLCYLWRAGWDEMSKTEKDTLKADCFGLESDFFVEKTVSTGWISKKRFWHSVCENIISTIRGYYFSGRF